MSSKKSTKGPAAKKAAPAAKPAKQPKTVYRVSEATEGRQLVGEYATADEATRKGLAHLAKHGVDVEVSRGKITGSTFKAEFTEVLKPGSEAKSESAMDAVATSPQSATDGASEEPAPEPEVAVKSAKQGGRTSKVEPAQPKAAKGRAARVVKTKKMSALDAAAKVLSEQAEAMSAPEMIEAMSKKGYWTSPNGATPHATLYAAIIREINAKGKDARFQKTDRGRFASAG